MSRADEKSQWQEKKLTARLIRQRNYDLCQHVDYWSCDVMRIQSGLSARFSRDANKRNSSAQRNRLPRIFRDIQQFSALAAKRRNIEIWLTLVSCHTGKVNNELWSSDEVFVWPAGKIDLDTLRCWKRPFGTSQGQSHLILVLSDSGRVAISVRQNGVLS